MGPHLVLLFFVTICLFIKVLLMIYPNQPQSLTLCTNVNEKSNVNTTLRIILHRQEYLTVKRGQETVIPRKKGYEYSTGGGGRECHTISGSVTYLTLKPVQIHVVRTVIHHLIQDYQQQSIEKQYRNNTVSLCVSMCV